MLFEAKIIEFLQAGANGFWLYFFRTFTLFGSWLGFTIALMFIFYKKKKLSYAFALTYAVGVLFNMMLKHIIMRPRPFESFTQILNYAGADGFSIPSGHANSCAMIAVFICFWAIKYSKHKATKICVPIIMALYVALICLSRMFLGAHYLTDVIAGFCEGTIIAIIGIIIFLHTQKKGRKNGETSKT